MMILNVHMFTLRLSPKTASEKSDGMYADTLEGSNDNQIGGALSTHCTDDVAPDVPWNDNIGVFLKR